MKIHSNKNIAIIPVPKAERDLPAYIYLYNEYGIKMCTDEKESDILFDCEECFSIFAVDKNGNY